MAPRSSQHGFTMIEVIVAIFVLMAGAIAMLTVFSSSKSTSLVAQRHEVAIAQAQKEIESLRSLSYEEVGLTRAPDANERLQDDPNKLGHYVGGNITESSRFIVRSGTPGVAEHLVLPDSASDGAVDPHPTNFQVGGTRGKVYRYVTWRPESCGYDAAGRELCPGSRQTKRMIVAVTLDSNGRSSLRKPVWIGTVVVDPDGRPYE